MFENLQMGRSLFGTLKLFSVSIWPLCLGSSSFGNSMADSESHGCVELYHPPRLHISTSGQRHADSLNAHFTRAKKGKRGSSVTRKRDLGVSPDLAPTARQNKTTTSSNFSILKRENGTDKHALAQM